jgi:YjbE family integral membrane protein
VHIVLSIFSIILIDLMLAGDNALVIAMAVRGLPQHQRRVATLWGAGAAVALRVGLTFVAALLLEKEYVQLVGGALILWIAVKVLRDANEPPHAAPSAGRLAQAIWYIVVADITMSTDNILAIAGASKGNLGLIIFGLAVSIPFVVVSSNLLAKLMDRFPWTVYLGAAILGEVAGRMMLTDPFIKRTLNPADTLRYTVQVGLALILFVAGWLMGRKKQPVAS